MSLSRTFASPSSRSLAARPAPLREREEPIPPPSVAEIPATFTPKTDEFDYVRRDEMIPMRDGVKLKTFVLVPKGAQGAPILLTRTPYNAAERMSRFQSPRLTSVVPQMMRHRGRGRLHHRVPGRARKIRLRRRLRDDAAAARAAQPDRHRPRDRHLRHDRLAGEERAREQRARRHDRRFLRGLHDADVDGAPAPGAQGRRAVRADGRRLDGRRLVPQRRLPRRTARSSTPTTRRRRAQSEKWWSGVYDTYDCMAARRASAGDHRRFARTRAARILACARRSTRATTLAGRSQAMDRLLAKEPLTVPMMIVGGLFDQEDIYGAPALYKALAPKDPDGRLRASRARALEPRAGPARRPRHRHGPVRGRHGGLVSARGDAAVPRPLPEGRAEARHAAGARLRDRRQRLASLRRLAALLRDGLRREDRAISTCCAGGGARLRAAGRDARRAFDEYLSDPAKPVPYRLRPTLDAQRPGESTWGEWLMDDQRTGRLPHRRARLRDGAAHGAAARGRRALRAALRLDDAAAMRTGWSRSSTSGRRSIRTTRSSAATSR